MWGPSLLLWALAGAPLEAPSVGERAPLVVVVLAPPQGPAQLAVSTILEATDRVVRPWTGLAVRSPEQAGAEPSALARCPTERRLTCWLTVAEALDPPPPFLLAVSVLARAGEPDRVSAVLLDVARGREVLRGVEGLDDREDLLQIHAVQSTLGASPLADVRALEAWLGTLLTERWRGPLEARGQWMPLGRVRLELDRAAHVELDGRPLGTLGPGEVLLDELRVGQRTLRLIAADGAAAQTLVLELEPGVEARPAVIWPSAVAPILRTTTAWAGVGVAAVGLGLATWAAVASPGVQGLTPCVGPACEAALPERWDDACTLTRDDPAGCGAGRGVRIAPLGLGLLAGGATWALGAALGEPEEWPWLVWLLGAAVGAASYGVMVAAEP